MACVYLITNKINGKKYVGVTVRSFKDRMIEHRRAPSHAAIHHAIRKYGWEAFTTEIIFEGTPEEAFSKEAEFIKLHNSLIEDNGYNQTTGGERKYLASEGTKKRMSDAHKGKKFTEDHKQKIADAVSGKRNGMYGKTSSFCGKQHSKKTIKNMSKTHQERYANMTQDERSDAKSAQRFVKTFMVKFPDGSIHEITNLKKFCRHNVLDYLKVLATLKLGKPRFGYQVLYEVIPGQVGVIATPKKI